MTSNIYTFLIGFKVKTKSSDLKILMTVGPGPKYTRTKDIRMIIFFRTESPSQIFMQVVRLTYLELKDVPEEDLEAMENYILCYDNI